MKKENDEPDIHRVEHRLNSKLQPVAPRRDFVNTLYAHLLEPSPVTIRNRKSFSDYWIIIGVISAMAVIISGVYVLLGIIKRLRANQNVNNYVMHHQTAQDQSISAPA